MTVTVTTRRAVVAGLAAAPVAALPAIASEIPADSDPIFAALERHKAAERAFIRTCDLTDDVRAEQEGRIVTEADEAAWDSAREVEEAALQTLVDTAPTSKAGARAAIEWLADYDRGYELRHVGQFAMTLLRSPVLADQEARS
ncbi:hypothetical protein [Methylocystis sp. SB2]|uniref:hypothetical protein n=1 Tax=Methylocystis sp. (strain SB2) TaxID=743836 RepID=UPI00040410EC|nr:hypothetical protein [Methylocystis sp. SB2]ULO22987.1 hypothetical protein LNB28_12550 [Methylocystis sp. SB2]